jgi:hypothetical protein
LHGPVDFVSVVEIAILTEPRGFAGELRGTETRIVLESIRVTSIGLKVSPLPVIVMIRCPSVVEISPTYSASRSLLMLKGSADSALDLAGLDAAHAGVHPLW